MTSFAHIQKEIASGRKRRREIELNVFFCLLIQSKYMARKINAQMKSLGKKIGAKKNRKKEN